MLYPKNMNKTELGVHRRYWPQAHELLHDKEGAYEALSLGSYVVLELNQKDALYLREALPEGAVFALEGPSPFAKRRAEQEALRGRLV